MDSACTVYCSPVYAWPYDCVGDGDQGRYEMCTGSSVLAKCVWHGA